MRKIQLAGITLSALLGGVFMSLPVQAQSNPAPAATTSAADLTDTQLLTITVHEAWVDSGRNEDTFFTLVKRCAEISSKNRGLTIPDTLAAGTKAGNIIKTTAKRDPGQLLYAVVDAAVRKTAVPTTSTATK